MSAGDLVTRIYSGFRGVDFRGDEINLVRSPDSLNMWKDYKETDSIRTRPHLKKIEFFRRAYPDEFSTGGTVYGIHNYTDQNMRDIYFIHYGKRLYLCAKNNNESLDKTENLCLLLYDDMAERPSESFMFEGNLYIKDGKNYIKSDVDGQSWSFSDGFAYTPTTSIANRPSGGGKLHEDVNMLSSKRKNTFLADGTSTEYFLDTQNLDEDVRVKVKINSVEIYEGFTVDYEKGKITFTEAPPAPLTDGQDNVEIEFEKTISGEKEKILNCTLLQVFDNRVFFSGNPKYPNMVWHCSLDNPGYVSDLDYYEEGFDTSAVKGMVAGNNALWVLKEPSPANTSLFYHTPTTDYEYGKIYPNTHSNISTGCIGKAINFNDDIVFFSERGMEGINADVTKEQVIAHRSTLVDRKLLAEPNYKNMILAEWEGYLLVFIDNKVYLADSRAMFTNENHVEYEWFYWELDKKITCASTHDGILYLGTEEGLYTLTDTTSDVESYWVTPLDKFKHPQYMKTTNKRGCVTEAKGDISLYVKTNKTDFELIVEHKDVKDSFISRIKRKKFKDIQLKFYSTTRFSLEASTLECFVGGYLKR